jgi:hypothetical protein
LEPTSERLRKGAFDELLEPTLETPQPHRAECNEGATRFRVGSDG